MSVEPYPFLTATILRITQEVADSFPEMFIKKGPGVGNKFTNEYMALLNSRVKQKLGDGYVEQRICKDTKQNVDFYIREERVVIEVELALYNVHTNLDWYFLIFLLARYDGEKIDRLLLVGKEPAKERHKQPASRSVIDWVRKNHNLEVLIEDIKNCNRENSC